MISIPMPFWKGEGGTPPAIEYLRIGLFAEDLTGVGATEAWVNRIGPDDTIVRWTDSGLLWNSPDEIRGTCAQLAPGAVDPIVPSPVLAVNDDFYARLTFSLQAFTGNIAPDNRVFAVELDGGDMLLELYVDTGPGATNGTVYAKATDTVGVATYTTPTEPITEGFINYAFGFYVEKTGPTSFDLFLVSPAGEGTPVSVPLALGLITEVRPVYGDFDPTVEDMTARISVFELVKPQSGYPS